jgi:hypothetical protein
MKFTDTILFWAPPVNTKFLEFHQKNFPRAQGASVEEVSGEAVTNEQLVERRCGRWSTRPFSPTPAAAPWSPEMWLVSYLSQHRG